MNDRLHPDFLSSVFEQSPAPFAFHHDEPVFSYVTRRLQLAVTSNRKEIIADLLGRSTIRPDKLIHAGFTHLADRIGLPGMSAEQFLDTRGFLRLFKPFLDQSHFRRAQQITLGSQATGLHKIVHSRSVKVFRSSPALCLKCIEEDCSSQGYAYYRRAHQVTASTYCAKHGEPLLENCPECGAPFSHWDVPSSVCPHCGQEMTPIPTQLANTNRQSHIRLSQVINAILAGEIDYVSEEQRLAALRRRTEVVVRNRSDCVGDNLARHLVNTFGRDFMQRLGLSPNDAPTVGWPALLIHGRHLTQDPISNSLLIAGLFDSVEHYREEVTRPESEARTHQRPPRRLIGAGNITMSVIREVIRAPTLQVLAAKLDLGKGELKKWVAAYPGLSKRRRKWLAQAKLKGCKRDISNLLAQQQLNSRNQVDQVLHTALLYVSRHDPAWLDRTLPSRTTEKVGPSYQNNSLTVEQDQLFCDQLREAVSQAANAPRRPVRHTPDRLVQMSGLGSIPKGKRHLFPITIALARELSEEPEEYYKRSLQWAARSLSYQFGRCDNASELFVHARVSVNYVKLLEPFALSLLDR